MYIFNISFLWSIKRIVVSLGVTVYPFLVLSSHTFPSKFFLLSVSSWLRTTLVNRNYVKGFQAGGRSVIRFGFLRSLIFEVTRHWFGVLWTTLVNRNYEV